MASLPRHAVLEDGSTFHVTWQCHNHSWLIRQRWAKRLYYSLLLFYKERYKVTLYSYCFMDNHIHLSGRLHNLPMFSDFFRVVNSRFAKEVNRQLKQRGQVVMDRFKSPLIQTDRDLLQVILYIDFNPKRAGKVTHPRHNEFSSYRCYALGEKDPLITPPATYLALGTTPEKRQAAYRALVQQILQCDWAEKRPYSSVLFIGDPSWVLQRSLEIKALRRQIYQEWKARHRARYASNL